MYRLLPADYCDRQTGRCRISPGRFKELGLAVGQWVRLQSTLHEQDLIYCRVWPARYDCQDTLLADRSIAKGAPSERGVRVKEGDRYDMTILPSTIPRALRLEVTVTRIRVDGKDSEDGSRYEEASDNLRRNIVQDALDSQVLGAGFTVTNEYCGLCIKVISSVPSTDGPILVTKGTLITISQEVQAVTDSISTSGVNKSQTSMDITQHLKVLPGLDGPIKALLEVVSYPLLYPDLIARLNIECPKGILLHGPPGVGKTLLVSTVAQYCRAQMVTIYGPEIFGPYVGESEEKLRQKFGQASRMALEDPERPVVIFIDELDALTPHRTDAQAHESRVVAQLLTLMDGVTSRGRVVVIAATNRPNSIDPALRRPGRFDREIRMEVPGESDRAKIIRGLIKDMPHTLADAELSSLARMTNGFVGADLEALCRESALSAIHREIASGVSISVTGGLGVKVTLADFKRAFKMNAPSLQRGYGVVVEPVRWTDIGGLEHVKTQLRQAVEWPVLHKDTFARLGLKAPRGILLYGPPGCSKTTLVKAIATNSGASFLSVNGAALYSSYVGDSEKTIRETFHQARLSAPSIIFFDEIDTIVGKRNFSAGGSGGDGGGDSVQERVLSTMLNEMDGVENATGVLIVAATNRVDLIDKALLRPGRFDRVVYVPPPDLEARRQILGIYTRDIPLADDVNLDAIAETTEMYTGADLQNVCREAALVALRTRILGTPSISTFAVGKDAPPQEPVNASDFGISLASVRPSLTAAMLVEYSTTGQKAF
ncbi:MAG: ATPases of AAA+ class, SpoVK, putative cell division [Linnemannia gamsii]|nr:MAG: ATPases of AAA+ class, SpoVK, putative cell division [Linnemannia gamsii]